MRGEACRPFGSKCHLRSWSHRCLSVTKPPLWNRMAVGFVEGAPSMHWSKKVRRALNRFSSSVMTGMSRRLGLSGHGSGVSMAKPPPCSATRLQASAVRSTSTLAFLTSSFSFPERPGSPEG